MIETMWKRNGEEEKTEKGTNERRKEDKQADSQVHRTRVLLAIRALDETQGPLRSRDFPGTGSRGARWSVTRILPTSTTPATGFTLALRTLTHIHARSHIFTRNLCEVHAEGRGEHEGCKRGQRWGVSTGQTSVHASYPSSLSLSLVLSPFDSPRQKKLFTEYVIPRSGFSQ